MMSGWISILQSEKQLLVHSNNVAQIRDAPTEKKPRGSTWNAAQNGCEKMSSACRTWSHACMHEFNSFPFDLASPTLRTLYSQPYLPLMSSLLTSTQPVLRGGEVDQLLARAGVH